MRCGNTAIEIVDLYGIGQNTCATDDQNEAWNKRYRTGYIPPGTTSTNPSVGIKCNCDNTMNFLNC
jgi:hypothetical protein